MYKHYMHVATLCILFLRIHYTSCTNSKVSVYDNNSNASNNSSSGYAVHCLLLPALPQVPRLTQYKFYRLTACK